MVNDNYSDSIQYAQEEDNAILSKAPSISITIMFFLYIILYLIDVFFKMNRTKLFFVFFYSYILLGLSMFLLDSFRQGMVRFNIFNLLKIIIVTLLMIYLPYLINLVAKDIYWLQGLIILLCPIYWFFCFFVEKTNFLFKIETLYFALLFILFALYMISAVSLSTEISTDIQESLEGTQLSVGVFDGIIQVITNPFKNIKENVESASEQISDNLNKEYFYFKYGYYYSESQVSSTPSSPKLSIDFSDRTKVVFDNSKQTYFSYVLNLENYGKPIDITTSCSVNYNGITDNALILTSKNKVDVYDFDLISSVPLSCYYDFTDKDLVTDVDFEVDAIMHMDTMSLYNPYAILNTEFLNLNQEPLTQTEIESVSNIYQPGPISIDLLTNLNYIILTKGDIADEILVQTLEFSVSKEWEGTINNFSYVYIRTPKYIPIKIEEGVNLLEITNDESKIQKHCIEPCYNSRGDQKQCESLCNIERYNFYEMTEESIQLLNDQIKKRDTDIGGFRYLLDTSKGDLTLNNLKKNQVFFSAYVAYDYKIEDSVPYELIKLESD